MPETLTVKGKETVLKSLENPLQGDAGNRSQYLREGGEIYFTKCFLCHGDLLDGSGVFGDRFFPKPANFRDPRSILSKPESYAYWRIMKGGQGLPRKFGPWDSAMPAWETVLTEEQAWKTILFIYDTARKPLWTAADPSAQPSAEKGKEIYLDKCAVCHGASGNGDGPAAGYTSPRPRKLSKGQYKIRTTHFGKIPADEDIFNIITQGMPGTAMPSWEHLPPADRWSLVLFLKALSPKFEKAREKGEIAESVVVGDPPPFTLKGLAQGRDLFIKNCSGCHGVKGRNDGESTKRVVNVESDAIWPRNLTKPWTFRRGSGRKDIFLTLRTGLSGTAMPRFSEKT
ncbi:MAG: c-type cytochrome, partial [Nitrospinae bacterium]|nr:c-type cytochrome [Nitrospinota bacterium]